jgi:Icc-related predicted phosphoesterase
MKKILCISDLHGFLLDDLPECDILIIGGDIAPTVDHSVIFQRSWFETNFTEWANQVPAKHIVAVAGNHDFVFQADEEFGSKLDIPNFTYLYDSLVRIEDLVIWGSPWSLNFGPWAFMGTEKQLEERYKLIPDEVDIIVSHTPPFSKRDLTIKDNKPSGSKQLGRIIRDKEPRLVVCGHIHEGYGIAKYGDTMIVNCSIMNVDYKPNNQPIMVDF